MVRAVVGLVVLLVSWGHAQTLTLAQVQERLTQAPVVRGSFVQERYLTLFPQPLASEGYFVISRGAGLIWTQETPMPMQLVLTGERLSQQLDGQTPQVIERKSQPGLFTFSELLLALFQGDTERLKASFQLAFATDEGGKWHLRLSPRDPLLMQMLKSISLHGSGYIEQLEIEEVRGDRTQIRFSNIKTDERLSQMELGALNG